MTFRMMFARVLGPIVALTAVGCPSSDLSGNSYYCDDTGCYDCDGYGCSTVPPPAPAACARNGPCPVGSICTDNGCVSRCSKNDDCAKGLVCTSGYCTKPGVPAPHGPQAFCQLYGVRFRPAPTAQSACPVWNVLDAEERRDVRARARLPSEYAGGKLWSGRGILHGRQQHLPVPQ